MSWADTDFARGERLASRPARLDDPEPPYAIADAWEPPHPLAVPTGLCDRLRRAGDVGVSAGGGQGECRLVDIGEDDRATIVSRLRQANATWWSLDIDHWDLNIVKRYRPGDRHPAHQDLHVGAARRKLAASVQLSAPADYDGGDLVMHPCGASAIERVPMPRTRGTLAVWPSWTVHEVLPVTRGERWALIINGMGPPLR